MQLKIKIKELRTANNLTQRELADLLKLTETNYRRLENNRLKNIPIETLEKLGVIFGCKISDILDFTEDTPHQ